MKPTWVKNPPTTLLEKVKLLKNLKRFFHSTGPKGRTLRRLWKEVKEEHSVQVQRAKEIQPLAFFKPSYEQALILNAWMYGVSFVCVYTANRIGKTTAAIINILLWLIPNDPSWTIFKPYTDEFGRLVRVFPRPNITHIRQIRKAIKRLRRLDPLLPAPDPSLPTYDKVNTPYLQSLQTASSTEGLPLLKSCWPEHPWPGGGTIWFGAPDHDHHEKIIFPLWKQYIPEGIRDRYSPSQKEISLKIQSNPNSNDPTHAGLKPRITCWEIIGKSYESKDTKWSSGAVDIIALTEGVTIETMKEIKLRFKDPAIGSHDFTPYEPANSGAATHLAHKIYKGSFPLGIAHTVFTKFSMRMAPAHIMSPELKAERIAGMEGDPEAKARIDGEFYTSSALVLSNLTREAHLLPYSQQQFLAILDHHNIKPQIIRAVDPGLDHPTACAWAYLLPSGHIVVYRIMAERGLTIPQRCKRIIELSNNVQSKIYYGKKTPTSTEFYKLETHPHPQSEVALATITDYHTFKEDEVTGLEYATNYILEGLPIVESVHTGPEDRAVHLDGMLAPSPYLPTLQPDPTSLALFHSHNKKVCNHCKLPTTFNPTTESETPVIPSLQGMPGGSKVYFLQYAMGILSTFLKWEDFYWDRKKSGDDKGQPKDTIPIHGDDELDAVTYITCSQYRWTNHFLPARMPNDSEPEDELIEWSQIHNQHRPQEVLQSLQTADAVGAGQAGHFGISQFSH